MSISIDEDSNLEILGYLKDNYNNIHYLGGNQYNKYYSAFNNKFIRDSCLKIIDKKKLEQGDYDYLLMQIEREEQILKLCKCDNIVNIYDKFEIENYIIFELELCFINLADYISVKGPLKKIYVFTMIF